MKCIFLVAALSLGCNIAFAQKGLPPSETFNANVNTFYPQHEDFKESLLSRLKLAPGYTMRVAAGGLGKPRMMAVGENHALYITRRDQGDVLLLTNPDANGRYQSMQTIITKFPGVHGITLHDGYLYLCANRELKRTKLDAKGLPGELELLIKDLPDGGQHGNRTIAFGPDGNLYISVGSDCNDCNETNPEHATMLQANAMGSNRRIYARGLRNTIGFAWHPQTKELWGMDNGTDWRGEEIPPEELNKITDGGIYGWPLVYGKQQPDPSREDPPGSTKEAYAKTTMPAVLTFPAHSAPINFMFLPGGDALVTWHGSWNKTKPDGFKVQRIKFNNGQPSEATDFFSGFLSADGQSRFGRPAGLALDKDGTIYVSDDANGIIYAIQPQK